MRGTLTIIPTKGAVSSRELAAPVTLEELQRDVGGYIERVPGLDRYKSKPCVAFCDEDGKRKQLQLNKRATDLWFRAVGEPVFETHDGPKDYLVGPVVVVTGDLDELLKKDDE